MNKFDKIYKSIVNEWVNYFPSAERTANNVKNAFVTHGEDIAIIDGEDNWNASQIFHIGFLLDQFNIKPLDDFHTGISGITKSGKVIKQSDLTEFIRKFNQKKYKLIEENPPRDAFGQPKIRIYNTETKTFDCFFSIEYKWKTIKAPLPFNKYHTTDQCDVFIVVDNFQRENKYLFTYDKNNNIIKNEI